ncbi:MAG: hypothetical protein HYV60_02955 [Planctomycetia bacterium]|nr:hypothetical protein [Planctomycetia bacterium]
MLRRFLMDGCGQRSVYAEYVKSSDCIKFAGVTADFLDQIRVFAGRGASMFQEIKITGSAYSIVAICAIAMSGCAAPMVPSQRLSCEDRQRLQDYGRAAMPYVAGPFMHSRNERAYVAQQATIQPPHSKFHPVPTRPVFENRAEYYPPQPMGVHLVPVPDNGWHSTVPRFHQPQPPLSNPPSRPAMSPESMDMRAYDESGPFMLQPPGN